MALESNAEQVPSSPKALTDWKKLNIIKVFVMEILVPTVSVFFYWSTRNEWPHHSR